MCTSREYLAALLRDSGFRDVGTPHLVDPLRLTRTAERVRYLRESAYVTVEAVRSLLGAGEADRSTVGIVLVSISVVIMPVLSWAQRRAGRELGSASAVAGLPADAAVHLPVRRGSARAAAQRCVRLVVGRPGRGARAGRSRGPRRTQRVARRGVLLSAVATGQGSASRLRRRLLPVGPGRKARG